MASSPYRYTWIPPDEDDESRVYQVLQEIRRDELEDEYRWTMYRLCRFYYRSRRHPLYKLMEREVSSVPLADECLDFCDFLCESVCGEDNSCLKGCLRRCEGGG